MTAEIAVDVAGRQVRVTKPDRILWPRLGLTKSWLIGYYRGVAAALLPHVRDHPLTLHRFPEGVDEKGWYQTRAPAHPPWVRTVTFRPERSGKVFEVVVVEDEAALVWAAQIGGIELHPFLASADALDHPRWLVFDLDPGPGAGMLDTARVAQRLRPLLADAGLHPFVKTSGRKGLHVVVPLDGTASYAETKPFARAVARLLVEDDPEHVTDNMAVRHRERRVLVDWSQNDAGKSTVAPYSLRALEVPTVSTPLRWEAVDDAVAAGDVARLALHAGDVLERLAGGLDPFATVEQHRSALPRLSPPGGTAARRSRPA